MSEVVYIDGSCGEGGGQVLRTALALSVLSGRPFRMTNIRARRANPGLAPQHLHAVRAFCQLSGGSCRGDAEGSRELTFSPGPVKNGSYRVDIGTAGSVTLVLQALALPLAMAEGISEISCRGGTHVPWSPPFNYIESCWLPFMTRIGIRMEIELERAGFYPRGGGVVSARIQGGSRLRPLILTERGDLQAIEVVSAAARLPTHVRHRQAGRARVGVLAAGVSPAVQLIEMEAASPGSVVAITGVFEQTRVVASALGARGKSAEKVGEEAAAEFRSYFDRPGAVDEHLADQLILPLVFAEGASEFTTVRVTRHLQSNADVIKAFVNCDIATGGDLGAPGRIRVSGMDRTP